MECFAERQAVALLDRNSKGIDTDALSMVGVQSARFLVEVEVRDKRSAWRTPGCSSTESDRIRDPLSESALMDALMRFIEMHVNV